MQTGKKIKVGVIGATGFTGEKLVELLLNHPQVKISYLSAKLDKQQKFSDLFPRFKKRLELVCKNLDIKEAASLAEVLFLALPHTVSFKVAPFFLKKNKVVIDLSADYRLKDIQAYRKFYKVTHRDKENLKKAAYGLPEFFRDEIKKARLIANPGCYPTVSILSIAPMLSENLIEDIIIDAKSGITGAGRTSSLAFHYAHLNGNLFSYKPFDHQHLPEINQVLSGIAKKEVNLRFTPHVIPAERGIFITVYANLTKNISKGQIFNIYEKYYKKEPFVRIFNQNLPQLKGVVGTNFCDIGFASEGRKLVIVGAIDNLVKGASGQAIQNMNIMLGFKEMMGLE
ncbi:MAG: N-acetyl-gamma-glutamyl-phosphate reductase [Candidatus Omnitrophica bacterium]|nr:N-acetyl-gamma-glutamyl-phosphate reductase [Candidatus Omnitrophota bacterium]MBU0878773.1 N-acetyl-gamma-glutamyl-phosphate reductase [Candidatus Omnitrophota bacterium]MBU0896149.1 N-acetyl-gamma-glutamyl-phosphate reductase [Candidatus Omnitrophota bacterium]MBU1134634.1 N-acetyl-gamma-glutamyl-phosphate reductase [Candidatus Omnitrophota bacterium]MBU1811279.1 N-acetyl-gamma-glutamyl-phosphate reductase [Candidatus Omnitrophota bacterium]